MKAKDNQAIAIWLYFGACCIMVQILLGGITRLSGSGLSITEWKPLMGFLPPLNELEWQHSFEQYKKIAQFQLVNAHFSLEDYKSIFFWEWFHRNWARFIGIAFLLPFIYFIVKGKIARKLLLPIFMLFLLGLLQAVIGWLMVKSGLNDTDISVSHIRLAIHFIAAIILLGYTLWLAFKLSLDHLKMRHRLQFSKLNSLILILLFIQLIYGALMAGSHAALAAPTWPDMNGSIIPSNILGQVFSIHQLTENLLTIQFLHRFLAYTICLLIVLLYIRTSSWKINTHLSYIRIIPVLLVLIQIISGVTALLQSVNGDYKTYALFHQFMGMLLTISLLLLFFLNQKKT
ncbi:COX15/CtaA family protein [Pedobacter sp. N36a]|uniref:COX15/CtaA family protein n=1 Tax=Pedobacter sp. N36a TaxID=2767996 RepID=UPI0016574B60|nr:COX15/CtaA family protein [Pedobacter sp. N36a]MBC8988290.1 COX15/CtaA family protein [Pedobacter sp. N36a]